MLAQLVKTKGTKEIHLLCLFSFFIFNGACLSSLASRLTFLFYFFIIGKLIKLGYLLEWWILLVATAPFVSS